MTYPILLPNMYFYPKLKAFSLYNSDGIFKAQLLLHEKLTLSKAHKKVQTYFLYTGWATTGLFWPTLRVQRLYYTGRVYLVFSLKLERNNGLLNT